MRCAFCILSYSTKAFINNLMPFLSKVPGDPMGEKKLIENSDKVFDYIQEIIEEHKEKYDENNIHDLTSAYIKEMKRLETSEEDTTKSCMYEV